MEAVDAQEDGELCQRGEHQVQQQGEEADQLGSASQWGPPQQQRWQPEEGGPRREQQVDVFEQAANGMDLRQVQLVQAAPQELPRPSPCLVRCAELS